MNNVIGGALIIGLGFVGYITLSGSGLDGRVRQCLEEFARQYAGGQDHVYMTEVVNEEIWRSFPDGTATRFVKYRVQGSDNIKSVTCRW